MVLSFWFYFRLIDVDSPSCLCGLSKLPKESFEAANPNIAVVGFGEWRFITVASQIDVHDIQDLQHLHPEDAELL